MGIKLVVFDCDGVLFDSMRANAAYYNHLAAKFGREKLTPDEERYVHVHTVFESVDYVFRHKPEVIEAVLDYRTGLTYVPFIKLLDPEPGVYECLDELSAAGYRLAILTNRSDTIGPVLETHKMTHYFSRVVSCLDVVNPKPDPEGMFKILDAEGIKPGQVVYIGDSPSDATTAANAGVHFIAYKNPELKAAVHIDHFARLKEALAELNGR